MDKDQPMNSAMRAAQIFAPVLSRPRRLLQNHDSLVQHLQIGMSVLASVLVMLGLAWWRDAGIVQQHYRVLAIIAGLLMVVIYEWRGVFRRFKGRIDGALRLGRSWTLVVSLVIVAIFVTKIGDDFSRLVIVGWALLSFALQIAGYQLSYKVSQRVRHRHGQPIRAVVLGSRWLAEHLVESITQNVWMPDRIIGIVDDDPAGLQKWKFTPSPCLGSFNELHQVIERNRINRIYIALPISCSSIIEWACKELSEVPVDVVWVPDIFALRLLNHSVREINGLPLISLSESPLMSQSQALAKNLMDKTLASLMLLVLSPLMLLVAYLVRRSSPGPIFFRQKRHGWDGRIIEVWKFRSMVMHEDNQVRQATRDDKRITPIGRFIRRTSIDELPQLFNVLQGTMSLVGPRPHAIEHNDLYTKKIRSYMMRHRIKPGLTGWAQINGLRGETETLEKMLRRVELDMEYINKWSIWLDVKIFVKTPGALLSKQAY